MGALRLRHVYGPVRSWRLGRSLGVDLLSDQKACTFDCIYCQAGETCLHTKTRKIYTPTKDIIKEIRAFSKAGTAYVTFSGRGEPTLAKNLGDAIKKIRRLRKEPVAVITNGSLLSRPDVRRELVLADYVLVKLDAANERLFKAIDRPVRGITLKSVISGIRRLRKQFDGRMSLQIMFVKENKKNCKQLARLAVSLGPDEIQVNTPLRPCGCRPLSKKDILSIKRVFEDETDIPVSCPFDFAG